MAKAISKSPARKPAAKAKRATRKKTVTRKKPAAPKKPVQQKKRLSPLKRLEGVILATVAEADELAVEMGLAGAVPPKTVRKKKTKR